MLDINLIITDTKHVHDALLKKGFDIDFEPVIKMYNQRKDLIQKADELKTEKNKLSASVPVVKKDKLPVKEEAAVKEEPSFEEGIQTLYIIEPGKRINIKELRGN